MKKFKTRNKHHYIKSIIILLVFILFGLLSFIKLDKSYSKFISIITKQFKNDNISFISLTKNLDYLINSYVFKIEEYNLNDKKVFLSYTKSMENIVLNKIEKIENSTETISEMLYHMIGD